MRYPMLRRRLRLAEDGTHYDARYFFPWTRPCRTKSSVISRTLWAVIRSRKWNRRPWLCHYNALTYGSGFSAFAPGQWNFRRATPNTKPRSSILTRPGETRRVVSLKPLRNITLVGAPGGDADCGGWEQLRTGVPARTEQLNELFQKCGQAAR